MTRTLRIDSVQLLLRLVIFQLELQGCLEAFLQRGNGFLEAMQVQIHGDKKSGLHSAERCSVCKMERKAWKRLKVIRWPEVSRSKPVVNAPSSEKSHVKVLILQLKRAQWDETAWGGLDFSHIDVWCFCFLCCTRLLPPPSASSFFLHRNKTQQNDATHIYYQRSILNYRLYTTDCQPSMVNYSLPTIGLQLSIVNL